MNNTDPNWTETKPMKELLPHQQRVVAELNELDEKVCNLSEFIDGEFFKTLSGGEQMLLVLQFHTMTAYSMVLNQRVNLWLGKK